MPFDQRTEVRGSLACGPGPDGHWHGWYSVEIRASALRRLGLHPSQPAAEPATPSPPQWWHHAAERRMRRGW